MPVFRCSRSGEKAVGNQRFGLFGCKFCGFKIFKKLLDGDEMICKMRTFAERDVERTNRKVRVASSLKTRRLIGVGSWSC